MRASLAALTRALEGSTGEFTPRDVGHALNGLRSSSAGVTEVRAVLAAIAPRIAAAAAAVPSAGGRGDLPTSDVALALQGLRHCQGSHTAVGQGRRGSGRALCQPPLPPLAAPPTHSDLPLQVQDVLAALLPFVRASQASMAPGDVATALQGLQHCSTNTRGVVADLLAALAPRIAACPPGTLSGTELATALDGLRGCHSSMWQTQRVLRALATHAEACPDTEELSPHGVALALGGLRSSTTAQAEVRVLLRALAPLVARRGPAREGGEDEAGSALSGLELGRALSGLQGCESGAPETRAVLAALSTRIPAAPPSAFFVDAEDLCHALFGLQCCSADSKEVRRGSGEDAGGCQLLVG